MILADSNTQENQVCDVEDDQLVAVQESEDLSFSWNSNDFNVYESIDNNPSTLSSEVEPKQDIVEETQQNHASFSDTEPKKDIAEKIEENLSTSSATKTEKVIKSKKNCVEFSKISLERQFEILLGWLKLSDLKSEIMAKEHKIIVDNLKNLTVQNLKDEVTSCDLSLFCGYFEEDSLKFLTSLVSKKLKLTATYKCGECKKKLKGSSVLCESCLKWFDKSCTKVTKIPEGSWFCKKCRQMDGSV